MLFDPRQEKVRGLEENEWTPAERVGWTLIIIALLGALFFLSGYASAHTATVSIVPSTRCSDGSPAETNCTLTGFRVEKQEGTAWIPRLLSAKQTQTVYDNLPAGQHFWRVFQLSGDKESSPPYLVSLTFSDGPAPTPPDVKRVTVETQAFRIKVDYTTFTFKRGSLSGSVPLGTPCETRNIGDGYHYVLKSRITALPGSTKPDYSVVKCSAQ